MTDGFYPGDWRRKSSFNKMSCCSNNLTQILLEDHRKCINQPLIVQLCMCELKFSILIWPDLRWFWRGKYLRKYFPLLNFKLFLQMRHCRSLQWNGLPTSQQFFQKTCLYFINTFFLRCPGQEALYTWQRKSVSQGKASLYTRWGVLGCHNKNQCSQPSLT